MKRAYVDLPGGQLHYRYCGQGEPLILIHMSGSSSDEFEEIGGYLQDSFSVYALDLPGFGYSYHPDHYYSMIEYRDTIIDFMNAMSIEKAVLIGNLVGADIAARVAYERPDMVRKLGLVQFIYNPDYEKFRSFRSFPAFAEVPMADDGSQLTEFWNRAGGGSWNAADPLPKEVVTARVMCYLNAGNYSEAMHWAMFEDENYDGILPNIKTPTVVVSLEAHSFAAVQPDVVKLLPDAELVRLEGAGSYFSRLSPEKYAQVVKEYF